MKLQEQEKLAFLVVMKLMGRELLHISAEERRSVEKVIIEIQQFLLQEKLDEKRQFARECAEKGITTEQGYRATRFVVAAMQRVTKGIGKKLLRS